MSRFVYATYCDDVRLEINGKTSLIGVYANAMFVQGFPTNLMKLCVVVNALTPPDRPFNGFKISALFNNKAIAEMEVPLAQLQEEASKPRDVVKERASTNDLCPSCHRPARRDEDPFHL